MEKTKFGLFRPQYTPDGSAHEMMKSLSDAAKRAESHGFDSFWLMDHFYQVESLGKVPDPVLDSWTALAAVATVTDRIRLGTLVTANIFRSPSLLAKITSTVDVLSNGRVFPGLGAAWAEEEAKAYGISFPPAAERLDRLEEAVQIITKMWTEERSTFSGKYYQIQEAYCNPKPIQKPHPPLLIGGSGERRTLKIVAKYADASNVFGSPETVKRKLDVLRDYCRVLNRDYDSILKTKLVNVFIYRDREEAKRRVASVLEGKSHIEIEEYDTYGNPDDVLQQLQDLRAVGIEYFMVHLEPARESESLDLFTDGVAEKL